MPSITVYQFSEGACRYSCKKIGLPSIIGDMKLTILTERIGADIPLLIGENSLEKAKAVLNFGDTNPCNPCNNR